MIDLAPLAKYRLPHLEAQCKARCAPNVPDQLAVGILGHTSFTITIDRDGQVEIYVAAQHRATHAHVLALCRKISIDPPGQHQLHRINKGRGLMWIAQEGKHHA